MTGLYGIINSDIYCNRVIRAILRKRNRAIDIHYNKDNDNVRYYAICITSL